MKRIGIKDLAKLLSLSPSTVSRALADHMDISLSTKERVRAAAREFNYLPNLHARYFRQKNSGLIALVLPEFNMFFIPALMDGINSILETSGYSIIMFFSNNNFIKEQEIINHCLSWVVDGVLISVSTDTSDCSHLTMLKDAGIPFVMLDKVIETNEFNAVTIDDKLAAFNATNHLIEKDKKNLIGIFGNPSLEITKKRVAGFKQALQSHHLAISDYDIVYIHRDTSDSNMLIEKLRTTPYDAAFIMSDELLMITYPHLVKYHLYPGQISIVSVSDGKLPYQLYPAITHIKHSGYEVGQLAAKMLIESIRGEHKITQLNIPTTLISLDSVFL